MIFGIPKELSMFKDIPESRVGLCPMGVKELTLPGATVYVESNAGERAGFSDADVNSAIEVDLTGQVCSDSIGTRIYSGFGGQVDFIRGAAQSRGGKPIIALPSTTRNGETSKIVPSLKPGAGVVTTRADVHYVVTEYGVAYLHGKNLRQRAGALIDIAHPDFRAMLEEEAEARKLL